MGFPTSHQPMFYATPNFLKMGIKYLLKKDGALLAYTGGCRPVSTIKDEKSAAKFHYIKTVRGYVVAQSTDF